MIGRGQYHIQFVARFFIVSTQLRIDIVKNVMIDCFVFFFSSEFSCLKIDSAVFVRFDLHSK